MKKMGVVAGVIGALVLVVSAAAPQFEEVPAGANKNLKAVKGKPIHAGMVFVNGHYVRPPYVLMRSGTALFLNNGIQITGQIVSWKAFLAAQGGSVASVPSQPAAPAPSRPVQNVDDLFADTPPPPSPSKTSTAPVASSGSEASFAHNEHTRRLLKRINDRRSYLDRKLREGNVIFFGARYPTVSVEPRLVRSLLAVLPEAMREANDGAQLFAVLRSKGVNYLNREICDELVENRQDYLQIIERRKAIEKDDELRNLLETGSRNRR